MRLFHPSTCLLFLLVVIGEEGSSLVESCGSSDPGGEFASWGFSCFKDMGVLWSSCKSPNVIETGGLVGDDKIHSSSLVNVTVGRVRVSGVGVCRVAVSSDMVNVKELTLN